jgi:hypothetical protein
MNYKVKENIDSKQNLNSKKHHFNKLTFYYNFKFIFLKLTLYK